VAASASPIRCWAKNRVTLCSCRAGCRISKSIGKTRRWRALTRLARRPRRRRRRRASLVPAKIFARPQPHRAGLRQAQKPDAKGRPTDAISNASVKILAQFSPNECALSQKRRKCVNPMQTALSTRNSSPSSAGPASRLCGASCRTRASVRLIRCSTTGSRACLPHWLEDRRDAARQENTGPRTGLP
jgi:hypothetical protein